MPVLRTLGDVQGGTAAGAWLSKLFELLTVPLCMVAAGRPFQQNACRPRCLNVIAADHRLVFRRLASFECKTDPAVIDGDRNERIYIPQIIR